MYPADMGPRIPPPPPPRPAAEPQAYTSRPGDTLDALAGGFGVDPADLQQANPGSFGADGQVDTGTRLQIPAAPMSVLYADPLTSDFNPTYPSPNSEYSVGAEGANTEGAITWNPGDGSVKGAVTQVETPPGQTDKSPVQLSARQETAVTLGQANKDGNTEFTVEVQFTNSVQAEANSRTSRGVVEGEASVGAGTRARYKVTLPGENQNPEAAARVNPFDPTTIPVGATVTLDGQNFAQGSLAGSFRHIGFETNVTEAAGVSYSVTRVDENNVQVTMGPNEAVEAFNGVGLRSEIATAMLGRQDNLGGSTVRTAQFDLSNPDGQAAYSHFVATGEVAHQTPGVSDVATIERVDYSSQTRLKLELGPLGADLAGAQNTGAFVRTTYPDGSYAYVSDLQYSGNVPMQVTQRFDAQGDEIVSERRYSYTVKADDGAHQLLNLAATGSFQAGDSGPVNDGDTVTLTFSEQQMQDLVGMTADYVEQVPTANEGVLLGYMESDGSRPTPTAFDFAVSLARNLNSSDYGLSMKLFNIASGADGLDNRTAVPIEMEVGTS
jgi:hypothetical protein